MKQKVKHEFSLALESYEFCKPMGSESEEDLVNERQKFGTADSSTSMYQIG